MEIRILRQQYYIRGNIDFKTKLIMKDFKKAFYNDKGINTRKRHII